MRLKLLSCVVFALIFVACDDDLSSVGMSVQPDGDRISVFTDTVSFTSSTEKVDSVLVNTTSGFLGNFNDPTYGNIKYGYLCNFYTPSENVFPADVIDDKIDSVILRLSYTSMYDSLAPMEATVYKVINPLERNLYSNINPDKYIVDKNTGKSIILGKKIYTAGGSDSLKITLPVSIGEELYKEWKDGDRSHFELENFFKFFPGIYVESTFGAGNILSASRTDLLVYFDTNKMLKDKEGKDSLNIIVPAKVTFPASAEVIQLNKFESRFVPQKLLEDTVYTYLKTPAGLVTELQIPLQDIRDKVGTDRIFNSVRLSLEVEEQPYIWDHTMEITPEVLLISRDSVETFFEKPYREADYKYSYYTYRSTASTPAYRYDFGNIAPLIQYSIANADMDTLKLRIVPIETRRDNNNNIISGFTNNYLKPSGAKLKKKDLKLYITTTKTRR